MSITAQIENAENLSKGRKALEKVKQQEMENVANGHRYITINGRTKVLVECDKNGKPTKRGRFQLATFKKMCL